MNWNKHLNMFNPFDPSIWIIIEAIHFGLECISCFIFPSLYQSLCFILVNSFKDSKDNNHLIYVIGVFYLFMLIISLRSIYNEKLRGVIISTLAVFYGVLLWVDFLSILKIDYSFSSNFYYLEYMSILIHLSFCLISCEITRSNFIF